MKYLSLLTATILLFHFSALSQNDSTRLDLGSSVLNRHFAQTVSIKGADLEKMPFVSLSEAINVWLYGTYSSNPAFITYVVDGNITIDVNTYSVHDIEEVVLVQNAMASSQLGNNQQQMVLITTRRGKGKQGVQAAAQTFLVHSPGTHTNLYHQYYVGAYKNMDKISVGLSANYLRDVVPITRTDGIDVITPDHLGRWRLNGYLTWRPDQKNTIDVHVGYTPQTIASNYTMESQNATPKYASGFLTHDQEKIFLPWVRWHGEWLPGLRNDLQVGYGSMTEKANTAQLTVTDPPSNSNSYNVTVTELNAHRWYFRDRLSYAAKAGGWMIEPSLNVVYEYHKYREAMGTSSEQGINVGPGNTDLGTILNTGASVQEGSNKLWLLTPSIAFTYGLRLDVRGGAMVYAGHTPGGLQQKAKRVYPFASASLELLKTDGQHASLQLFGSYAQKGNFIFNDYRVNDVSSPYASFFNSVPIVIYTTGSPTVYPLMTIGGKAVKTFWNWQTGARWVSLDHRLQLSYHLDRMNLVTLSQFLTPGGPVLAYAEWKSLQHFAGISYKLVDRQDFGWQSGLTATLIKNSADPAAYAYNYTSLQGPHTDGNGHPSWTGGWTNRLQVKDLSFGLDMLYHINREIAFTGNGGTLIAVRENQLLLQNVYAGYTMHLSGGKTLEIYADARGLVRGSKNMQVDTRRYYGIGGKIAM